MVWLIAALLMQGAPIQVSRRADLRKGLQSMPRVSAGQGVSSDIAAKLNARLARVDADIVASSRACDRALQAAHQEGGVERQVNVTMRGPRFLSVLAEDTFDCATAHTEDGQLALVYDLTTGSPVNWLTLLPDGAKAARDTGPHGEVLGFVVWPVLQKMALDAAEPDCKQVYTREPGMEFTLWLDGASGSIMARAAGLVHYDSALCGEPVRIDAAAQKRLGVVPVLQEALAMASQNRRKNTK